MNKEKFKQAQKLSAKIEDNKNLLDELNSKYKLKIQSLCPLYPENNFWSDVLTIDDELRTVIAEFIDTRITQLEKEFEKL